MNKMEKKEPLQQIKFSYNWNNKLNCLAFTTIRLANVKKYKIGNLYEIVFKDEAIKVAKLESIRTMHLKLIDEQCTLIDTGYPKSLFDDMIKRMYKKYNIDWSNQQLMILTLKYIDTEY